MEETEKKSDKKFVYTTRTSPFHLRFLGFFIILLMFALIPLIVLMSTKTTRSRSSAAPSSTMLVTSSVNPASVGSKVPVQVQLDPGTNLVAVVKLVLTYDSSKLSTASGFVLDPKSFPVALTTPVYTCSDSGTTCKISVTASIGTDPTKVIQTKTILGTIDFLALAPANQTQVAVGSETQVFSTDANSLASQNVLSTTNPLLLSIAQSTLSPTPMACGGFIAHPPTCPTGYYCDHTGVNPDLPGKCVPLTPAPKPTCIPRPPCLDATPRCLPPEPIGGWCPLTPTPSIVTPTGIGSEDSFASIAIGSPGIENENQLNHPTRSVTITLYNIQTKQSYTAVDTVKFDGKDSFINDHFDLGAIPSGTYQLLLTLPQHLRKLLTQADNTNVFTIQQGSTITVPKTDLVIGDIAPIPGTDDQPFGDNVLDISDYNQLISCYGDAKPDKCSDVGRLAADLNDDGTVNAVDYNIMLRSFAIRQGDTTPSAGSGSPTPIALTVTPACIQRPWCVDHAPYCRIVEPAGGWCPVPFVHIITPPNGAIINGIMQLPVQVMANEPNGTIAKINLYLDTYPNPVATIPHGGTSIVKIDMFGYHHDDCASHPVTITATAIDSVGNSNSDKINITWNDTCPPSPSISQ